jgi:hypothetical protein
MKYTSQNNAIFSFLERLKVAFKIVDCPLLKVQTSTKSWI